MGLLAKEADIVIPAGEWWMYALGVGIVGMVVVGVWVGRRVLRRGADSAR